MLRCFEAAKLTPEALCPTRPRGTARTRRLARTRSNARSILSRLGLGRTLEALPRTRPRLHRGARNGLERRRHSLELIDAGDPARAMRQLAIERGHRAREPRLGILEPDGEDARPGEREPLQFQRAGSAIAVDP